MKILKARLYIVPKDRYFNTELGIVNLIILGLIFIL